MAEQHNDDSAMWNARRRHSQAKRAGNTAASTETLRRAGIQFTTHNRGAHLKLKAGALDIDFWPGTGLWVARAINPIRRRGVQELLTFVWQLEKP